MNIQKLLYQNVFWRGLFYLSAFILNILIARHFEAALTGWIYYIFNIYSFVTLIFSFSLEAGMVYFASKKEISLSKLFSFSVIWVCLVAVVIMICFIWISHFTKNIRFVTFQFAFLFVCGNILLSFLTSLFYAQQKYIAPNVTGICINVFLMFILLSLNENRPWINNDVFIYIYFGSFLIQAILLAAFMMRKLPRPLQFSLPDKPHLQILFRYCMLAFIANFITFLLYRIDYWFVNRYCTLEQLGNYIQVSKMAQMFFILPGILASTVFPLTAGDGSNQIKNSLMVLSRSLLFFYAIACGILAITGRWLFPFVFGKSFAGMYIPFLLIVPGILALSTLYTLTAYFSGKNRISVNLKGSVIAVIFIISGDAFLIPKYGINAAAAVTSIGYIIYHIYVLSIFIKEHKTPVIDFFYFRFSDLQRMKRSITKNIKIV